MGERAGDAPRYTAFLSYSHKDSAAAGRLHRRLEAYRMPKRLVGTETARGPVPERLAPIFRDRDELPAATDLSETVREALAQSGALIILCSPHAAESLWVAEEIETFRRLHPDRPILAAVLGGDLPDCFPAALRAFGQDGTWHEPLATDLRPHRDGRRLGLLKLVAGITGVGLDALVQRDAQRKIRRVMAVTAAALIAMVMMAALALVALNARREAERQRAEAEGLVEFMLTDLRERLRGVGRLSIMTAANQRALAYYDRQLALHDRPADSAMRARVIHAIGEDELIRGNLRAAQAMLREIHGRTAQLLSRSPNDPTFVYAHAQSEFWLGRVAYDLGDYPRAKRAFDRYLTLADRLVSTDPRNPRWLREYAFAEGNLCSIALAGPVDAGAALRLCASALSRMEFVRSLRRGDASLDVDLANRHAWMALAWNENGRWDRVQFHHGRHEELIKALIRSDPDNTDYRDIRIQELMWFAERLAQHGRPGDARRRLAEVATMLTTLVRLDPENASWREHQRRLGTVRARIGG
jgi:tetratricopeptide (TPR) repeat protein